MHVSGTSTSKSELNLDIGKTGVVGGVGAKIDLAGKVNIPLNSNGTNSKRCSPLDNTKVDNSQLAMKYEFF